MIYLAAYLRVRACPLPYAIAPVLYHIHMKKWQLAIIGIAVICFVLSPFGYAGLNPSANIDWSSWWSLGTFLVTVAAALIAYSEYLGHKKEIEVQSAQKEKDYISQTRPYVTLRVVFERWIVYLEVKNIGHTPARNIKLKVDPKLEKLAEKHEQYRLIHHALSKPITFMAPGQRLLFFICMSPEAVEAYRENPDDSSFPATVEYENMDQQSFTESYDLDLGDYVDTTQEPDPLGNISKSINAIATTIERSVKAEGKGLNQISQTIDSLNSGNNDTPLGSDERARQ